MVLIKVEPIGKPRMVRSDRWRERKCVSQYWAYRDRVRLAAKLQHYRLGETLDVTFYLPMPPSWSRKKRAEMEHRFHRQKPDLDNLVKAFLDALTSDDSGVHEITARKRWGTEGLIMVEERGTP